MGNASDQPPSTPRRSSWDSEELAHAIIGAALRVHRVLGPGLLESAYQACLVHELSKLSIPCRTQVALPVKYGDVKLDVGYRLDLLVDGQIVVEVKSVARLDPVHAAQLMTYLRLANVPVGLLMNFNEVLLKDGLRRIVNQYRDHPA
jgi:GxxExxY protein